MSVFPVVLFATLAVLIPGIPLVAGQGLFGLLSALLGSLTSTQLLQVFSSSLFSGLIAQVTATLNQLIGSILSLLFSVLGNSTSTFTPSQLSCLLNATTSALNGVTALVPQLLSVVGNNTVPIVSGVSLNSLLPSGLNSTINGGLLASANASFIKCLA